jgi:hypothetical protein
MLNIHKELGFVAFMHANFTVKKKVEHGNL